MQVGHVQHRLRGERVAHGHGAADGLPRKLGRDRGNRPPVAPVTSRDISAFLFDRLSDLQRFDGQEIVTEALHAPIDFALARKAALYHLREHGGQSYVFWRRSPYASITSTALPSTRPASMSACARPASSSG